MFAILKQLLLTVCFCFFQLYCECLNVAWTMKTPRSPRRQKVTCTLFPSVLMKKKSSVTQMATPDPSQVPCAPAEQRHSQLGEHGFVFCVVLKCLHQANTINSAEQCHALTLTIYLLKISTALTCVTIKRLTNDPPILRL